MICSWRITTYHNTRVNSNHGQLRESLRKVERLYCKFFVSMLWQNCKHQMVNKAVIEGSSFVWMKKRRSCHILRFLFNIKMHI